MIRIRESCYGRQRISLKIVIHSRVRVIAAYVSVLTNGNYYGNYSYLAIAIFHGRWITLSSSAHTYVNDLHLIVPKFKAIR